MLVIDAVIDSKLPADIRHLLMVMAYLADNETGSGYTGQTRLAEAMGLVDGPNGARELRRKLERLDAIPDSPVRVERRRRARSDGQGRTSDEYQLVLVKRTSESARTPPASGRGSPLEGTPPESVQPDVHVRPSGRPRPNQPDAQVLGSSQGILSADPLRSSARASRAPKVQPLRLEVVPPSKPPHASKPKKAKPETKWPGVHKAAIEIYTEGFKRTRGADPFFGPREAKAVSKLLDAVAGDLARFREIVENGLANWDQATILTIAADPSKSVTRRTNGFRGPVQQTGVDVLAGVKVFR